MDDDKDFVLEALHIESFAWMVMSLSEEDRKRFMADYEPLAERAAAAAQTVQRTMTLDWVLDSELHPVVKEMGAAVFALATYVRSWTVSVKLSADEDWRSDLKRSQAAFEAGRRDPIGEMELFRLLEV